MKKSILYILMLLFSASLVSAEDSALVKAAKKEKERRAKLQSGKTFTNKDVDEFKRKNKLDEEETQTEETSDQAADPAATTTEKPADKGLDEAYWRGRFQEASARVKDAEAAIESLKLERAQLKTTFYNTDGFQQPALQAEMDKKDQDMATAEAELQAAKDALEALEKEARTAGAPPGWVRE